MIEGKDKPDLASAGIVNYDRKEGCKLKCNYGHKLQS
jgi:hypothetical protein